MTSHDREPPNPGLARLLGRVASDHRRADHLHQILRWYCHESRNSLNSLKMSIYLAKRTGGASAAVAWADVEARYDELERYVDRLHRLCRPTALSPIRAPLDLLFEERREAWRSELAARGLRLELQSPASPAVGSFDPALLGAALDDLVSWRARLGVPGTAVRLGWSAEADTLHVDWSEPGGRPRRRRPQVQGGPDALSVFCLPLLTRVVTLHGGTVKASERGCWRLELRWPSTAAGTP